MLKLLRAIGLTSCLVLTLARADYSNLLVSASAPGGQVITVSVQNPTSEAVTARIRVSVRLDDDTLVVLTSPNLTIAAGASASISVPTAKPVAEIGDNPEPIPAL